MVKTLPGNAGDIRDKSLIPGLGGSPGGGHGNPLQYSGLENPMDRDAWWAPWTTKSQTRLKQLSMHAINACCVKLIGFGLLCGVAREN